MTEIGLHWINGEAGIHSLDGWQLHKLTGFAQSRTYSPIMTIPLTMIALRPATFRPSAQITGLIEKLPFPKSRRYDF